MGYGMLTIQNELRAINKTVKVYEANARHTLTGESKLDLIMNFINDAMINRMLELRYDFSYVEPYTAVKIRAVFDKLEKQSK